jgi:hypothetical protein
VRRANSIVEVNGDADTATASGENEWTVEVTGLKGSTEYDFEFVKTSSGILFYRMSACTVPAQGKIADVVFPEKRIVRLTNQASATPANKHPQQPSRPLSPVTTLLHSIAQANSRLTDGLYLFHPSPTEEQRVRGSRVCPR